MIWIFVGVLAFCILGIVMYRFLFRNISWKVNFFVSIFLALCAVASLILIIVFRKTL